VSRSLEAGKHVLIEKPFVLDEGTAALLLAKAKERRLLIMENILFPRHSQYAWVRDRLASGQLGPVRLFRTVFTVPPFQPDNFRYQASLGGGALMDLGPYMVRFARAFLGTAATLLAATVSEDARRRVDISGTAVFGNNAQQVAQLAWGFDSHYQCTWEFFGAEAKLTVERGYTPPPGFKPGVRLEYHDHSEEIVLPADNHYRNTCECFARAILDGMPFDPHWDDLAAQAKYLEQIRVRAVRL
jgi:predicted dehydrogenase